jgi:hypothetical protein
MISRFKRYFELVQYFRQFKLIKLRMVVGLPTFEKIFDSTYYTDLRGGLLEALGAMFQDNVKVYLYPAIDLSTGEVIYPTDNYFKGKDSLLWQYLNATANILQLTSLNSKNLTITSEMVSSMIENGDEALSAYLPEKVYQHIKENKLFGFERNKK